MFPSIKELTRALQEVVDDLDGGEETDVRLQVKRSGWCFHVGDSSYDQDHRGWWGASSVDSTSDCEEVASELIEQARDHKAQSHVYDLGGES